MHRIDRVETGSPVLLERLKGHPSVALALLGVQEKGLAFWQGEWRREVRVGDPGAELSGIVELMDNNPLVCADSMSVPDPVSTLVLLALGPVIDGGLLVEAPVVLTNFPFEEQRTDAFLAQHHWDQGVILTGEDVGELGAVVVNAFAKIRTPGELDEIDALYEERYGRSFYVRRDEVSEWDTKLVDGSPIAVYRLRITAGEGESLLTIQTMADPEGKCGSCQVIHAMNVMAGLEESLGI